MKKFGVLTKSDNALAAEADGRFPMSSAKRELRNLLPQLTLRQCEALLEHRHDGEWHHIGSYANEVNYYNVMDAAEWYDENRKEAERLLNGVALPNNSVQQVQAKIAWTEWTGSRNRPEAHEYEFNGPATIKGDWITFVEIVGDRNIQRRKKISGNWINVTIFKSPKEEVAEWRQKNELIQQIGDKDLRRWRRWLTDTEVDQIRRERSRTAQYRKSQRRYVRIKSKAYSLVNGHSGQRQSRIAAWKVSVNETSSVQIVTVGRYSRQFESDDPNHVANYIAKVITDEDYRTAAHDEEGKYRSL